MGAPEYSPQRIKLIGKLLADKTPLGKAAEIIGVSKTALRLWVMRHGAEHGIRRDVKVYNRPPKTPAPDPAQQPGA